MEKHLYIDDTPNTPEEQVLKDEADKGLIDACKQKYGDTLGFYSTANTARDMDTIRAALGECFGFAPGTPTTGKMVTALRLMGFEKVFDTNIGADLTIIEESAEFISRLQKNERLPLITSCSPGWVAFMERFYPETIPLASQTRN